MVTKSSAPKRATRSVGGRVTAVAEPRPTEGARPGYVGTERDADALLLQVGVSTSPGEDPWPWIRRLAARLGGAFPRDELMINVNLAMARIVYVKLRGSSCRSPRVRALNATNMKLADAAMARCYMPAYTGKDPSAWIRRLSLSVMDAFPDGAPASELNEEAGRIVYLKLCLRAP